MFYNAGGDGVTTVNCAVQPNVDVSGIGIRCAFYLQAIFSIVLSTGKNLPKDLFLANLSLLSTSLSIIAGVYFDSTIDVVHTIMASHLAVMLSACTTPASAYPSRVLQASEALKATIGVILLDLFFRPFLLAFNLAVWSNIRHLQQNTLCPDGAGLWVFLGGEVDRIDVSTLASAAAFTFVVCDAVWGGMHMIAETSRLWLLSRQQFDRRQVLYEIRIPPLIWWASKEPRLKRFRRIFDIRYSRASVYFSLFLKIATCMYVLSIMERMVGVNNLRNSNPQWTFGQVFAITNSLAMFALVCKRNLKLPRKSSRSHYICFADVSVNTSVTDVICLFLAGITSPVITLISMGLLMQSAIGEIIMGAVFRPLDYVSDEQVSLFISIVINLYVILVGGTVFVVGILFPSCLLGTLAFFLIWFIFWFPIELIHTFSGVRTGNIPSSLMVRLEWFRTLFNDD